METVLIVVFAIATMGFASAVAVLSTKSSWIISPLSLYTVVSIFFVNIGFLVFYLSNVYEPWARTAILVVTVGLLAVSIGGVMGIFLFGSTEKWKMAMSPNVRIMNYNNALRSSLIIFSVVLTYFYLIGYIPLVEGIITLINHGFKAGLVNTFRINRDIYVNEDAVYVPMQGLFEMFRYFGLPLVAIWFINFYREGMNSKLSILMVISSAILTTMSGQRWPLMYMIFSIIVYLSWKVKDARKFRRVAMRTMGIAVLLGIIMSSLLGRAGQRGMGVLGHISSGAVDLTERIIYGNVKVPFESYKFFPDTYGFLLGKSWLLNISTYLPGPGASFPVEFYQLVRGDKIGNTAPPDFYTEAYINFGWIGVIVISVIWGIFLSGFQRLIVVNRNKSMIITSIMVFVVVMVSFAAISGMSFIIGGIIVFAIIFAMVFVQRLMFSGLNHKYHVRSRKVGKA